MSPFRAHIKRFTSEDDGSTLVEFGIIMGLFLFLIFGLIDFSRLGMSYVMSQKATERAVRQAAVLPAICPGLPKTNTRGILEGATEELEFGAACSIDDNLCSDGGVQSCSAATASPTADLIWAEVSPLLPTNAQRENLRFTYRFDPNLGFLGGPYTPLVTVEIVNLEFEFVTPLGGLAALAGAANAGAVGADFSFPSMSASLPSEALGRL
ncbi:TadE-like protein [Litoreibacter ponti]|uniref:TadE-like protein n=1 Tax=Litoreibacter ponti TaxID=1510457 RepID=A0A2T6BF08_9RHOB|nr:TadE/TadG family type IV pilus assembly protein [Litoreibacter ponti]PTX54648.1 TadE-like protein [Litoreibacter ponti]